MNRSMTKSKAIIVALSVIMLICLFFAASVAEIVQTHKYKKQIEAQKQYIQQLQNAKDYYEDKLDDLEYSDKDLIFEEE